MTDRATVEKAILADYRTVSRAIDKTVLPTLVERGVTMAQFKALIALVSADEGGVTVTALGRELGIGQPSASLLVDQLVKKGYALRSVATQDRRCVPVQITPSGEELVTELRQGRRSTFMTWLALLDEEDESALASGMAALARIVAAQ